MANHQVSPPPRASASNKRQQFYIDELGFYRHLDPEQRQYVCSNTSSGPLRERGDNENSERSVKKVLNNTDSNNNRGDGGFEICFREIRRDLGISHFDRTDNHENWKRGWDEFMRVKLLSQQPVILNDELKNRVRSGIPHDYRCKVWTALIRMRTRPIRDQFGDDIYRAIVLDFVSKVDVPNYVNSTNSSRANQSNDSQNNDPSSSSNNNNNNGESISNQGNRVEKSGSSYLGGGGGQPVASVGRRPESLSIHNGGGSDKPPPRSFVSQKPFVTQEPMIDKCFKQIELDLLRTLPNNRHFENPNSRGIQRVRRVLRAYACFNQSVGYCQGMNRLAAMALLVLPEEEAFWCLVAITQCIMPKDYYLKPWLAQVDCCVLSDLLEKKMPKLHKHLVKNDIQLTLFTWFFTIFVDGFRPELMLRIWDCFLLEGDKVLFRFALAILFITQDDLLEMNDFSTMSTHLSRLVSTRKLDMEHLFEIAFETMNPLSSATIQSRRDAHRNQMQSVMDD